MNFLLNIDVPDLERATTFYTAAFGLRPARQLGPDVLELLGLQVPVYLLRKAAGTTGAGTSVRDYGRHWTPVHGDIAVEDLDAALDDAVRAGARQEGEVRSAAWGRIVQVADPFGHGWCLIEFTARGYDALADG